MRRPLQSAPRSADTTAVRGARKLIEVALPLDPINAAAAREKSIRHGHPSTLHLWWARRPLAAARAVIFAQMVDDPSEYVDVLLSDPQKKRAAQRVLRQRRTDDGGPGARSADERQRLREIAAEQERERLFGILEELVKWENTTNETVLEQARTEIWQSWRRACAQNADRPKLFDRDTLPAFHDPFAGGGALPLEAQRLGLEAHASDLNPVAVLINKAMIEFPPKFAGRPPVNPEARGETTIVEKTWSGAQGLAEDVRHYGRWMRDEAEQRIGHLYPPIEITREIVRERPDLKAYQGQKLTVIAWLWARTVKSPNPAFADVDVPLASTFMLSTKRGREAYVEPVIDGRGYRLAVRVGEPPDADSVKAGTKLARKATFRCLMSGSPIPNEYIKAEGLSQRMGQRMLAIVAEGDRGRVYVAPEDAHERATQVSVPSWRPELNMPRDRRWFSPPLYGFPSYGDVFTSRQLAALTTFSDLVGEATARVRRDAVAAGLPDDGRPLREGGTGSTAYAEAVSLYLAFAQSKACNRNTSLCLWERRMDRLVATFGRQALPMIWDFAETNPLAGAGGDILGTVESVCEVIERQFNQTIRSVASQGNAVSQQTSAGKIVSTDPPYYDNIGYADLSDFFYVWLRRSLRPVFPELFATLAVPKAEELVATPYRHGSRESAEAFFLDGMTQALRRLAELAHPALPVTIYYAFKQAETKRDSGTSSTGWETFLDAVIRSGFSITGTWPMRTEQPKGLRAYAQNALASSIVLVCRRRPADALAATRREFLSALRSELPQALRLLQSGNVAPVDLAQAAIGPGMGVYTRYERVLDAAGQSMSVREALALINQILDEVLAEQEGDFDADSRWAVAWFEQHGFDEGEYGIAETLSKAKNTSVAGMVEAGILASKGGTVRLLAPEELSDDWDPAVDARLTTWETVHHLVRVLEKCGETGAAEIVAVLGGRAETVRELCYRLYTLCERKKRAAEALRYNTLVQSWSEITRLARSAPAEQAALFSDSH